MGVQGVEGGLPREEGLLLAVSRGRGFAAWCAGSLPPWLASGPVLFRSKGGAGGLSLLLLLPLPQAGLP